MLYLYSLTGIIKEWIIRRTHHIIFIYGTLQFLLFLQIDFESLFSLVYHLRFLSGAFVKSILTIRVLYTFWSISLCKLTAFISSLFHFSSHFCSLLLTYRFHSIIILYFRFLRNTFPQFCLFPFTPFCSFLAHT